MDTPFLVFSCWFHVRLCAVSLSFCLSPTLSCSLSLGQCSFSTFFLLPALSFNHSFSCQMSPLLCSTSSQGLSRSIPVPHLSWLFFFPFLTFFLLHLSSFYHPRHSLSLLHLKGRFSTLKDGTTDEHTDRTSLFSHS